MTDRDYAFKHPLKKVAAQCLDALGDGYRHFFPFPKASFESQRIKKILLIRLDHLGDVIMVRPALDAVLSHFPDATVDFLVASSHVGLFSREPRLNVIPVTHQWFSRQSSWFQQILEMKRLIPMLRRERYDLGIDFRGDLRNILLMTLAGIPERIGYDITGGGFLLTHPVIYDRELHQIDLNMNLLTSLGISEGPTLRPFLYAKEQKELYLTKSAQSFRMIIHPGAGYPSKKWPEENFKELIDKILARYSFVHVILIGTREDQVQFPILERERSLTDLRGKTRIEDLPALFECAHLYLGNDSGPAHLAASQGLAGIILFSGTNQAAIWRPRSERFTILRHEVPCSPCEAPQCPLGHHDCMQKISVDEVFGAIENCLASVKGLKT